MRHDEDEQRRDGGASHERHERMAQTDSFDVTCPFCHSGDVELVSLFGGQLSTDQYYCRACHTYFERVARDDEGMPPS